MWQYPVSIIAYLLVAAVVVFLSIKLSTLVDLLDKKTNLSGALLGGVLLAATTSLPELFTAITASLLVNNNDLVLGDILGSNLFNIILFAIIYIFFFKKMINANIGKNNIFMFIALAIFYSLVAIAGYVFNFNHILFGWFNPVSILIIVIYALYILKMPKQEEPDDEDEVETKLSVKQIVILFVIFALALVGASIGMTYLTNWVVDVYGFGATFGGALFLGVATSLPELTATINLARRSNINAAYGNIVGSNVFNFAILSIADLLSFNCPTTLYYFDQGAFLLLIFGVISTTLLCLSIIVKIFFKPKDSGLMRFYFTASGVLFIVNYLAFLILSNIDLNLAFAPFRITA